ncbi:MAG: MFS transporter [Alphaproteobacteria bacterium]
MGAALKPVFALLFAGSIFLVGNGLQTSLVPLSAELHGINKPVIGLIGALYFVGFGAGCLVGPSLLQRVGHVKVYGAMTALGGGAMAFYVLSADPALWAVLRMITGFAFAILYMVIESWLNEIATNDNRGTIFSTYTFLNLTVVTAGQSMIVLADPTAPTLFAINAGLVTFAALPLLLSNTAQPSMIEINPVRMKLLFQKSPAGVMGGVAVGLGNGAFWSLAPNFGLGIGLDVNGIASFMALGVLAGALGQVPLGRLSDKLDRRLVIMGASISAMFACAFMGMIAVPGTTIMAGMVWFGLFAFPVYGLCVAHVNDRVAPGQFVGAASAMLLLYAVGAVAGPIIAAFVMEWMGASALFLYIGGVYGILVLLILVRVGVRSRVEEEDREDFVAVPRPSPAAAMLDPRGADGDSEEVDLPIIGQSEEH